MTVVQVSTMIVEIQALVNVIINLYLILYLECGYGCDECTSYSNCAYC
jgi:hypothetical protein